MLYYITASEVRQGLFIHKSANFDDSLFIREIGLWRVVGGVVTRVVTRGGVNG